MPYVVLNQYRTGSSYKDEVGTLYHFPKRYLKAINRPETRFIYYEPRAGGDQIYFGCGSIGEIWQDPEDEAHFYAEVLDYAAFRKPVSYWDKRGSTREAAKRMRNSVRFIDEPTYVSVLESGGIGKRTGSAPAGSSGELEQLYVGATPEVKRFLASRYERPNLATKVVKETLGPTCQVCGYEGFRMKNGKKYCEVHHIFHLAKRLPGSLSPRYLVVVCATCHRKFHYGLAEDPEEKQGRWVFRLDGQLVSVPVFSGT